MMKTEQAPKIIAKGSNGDRATLIYCLLMMGLWDFLSPVDREAWVERAEVLDTEGGRRLFSDLKRRGMF